MRLTRQTIHRSILGALLLALVAGAATLDRSEAWPEPVGDESTYLMQAESLAFDGDLTYSRRDFARFVRHWGVRPEGVILQKGEESAELVYGKPFFYAAWAAPFVRLSPTRGPFVANAVLLALAALAAARALRPRVGPAAPSWVALYVFGSVTFAHVFWAHLDLFLACLAAIGLALAFGEGGEVGDGDGDRKGRSLRSRSTRYARSGQAHSAGARPAATIAVDGRRPSPLRWAAAGALLAAVAYSRPFYLTLLLPATVAALAGTGAPRPRRAWRPAAAGLAAGAVVLALVAFLVHQGLAGSWTSYGAERRSFTSATGFPGVDLPPGAWDEMVERWGNASWVAPGKLAGTWPGTPRLWGWNTLYLLAGESVGLLPYMLPGFLGLATWIGIRGRSRDADGAGAAPGLARWALLAAVAVTAAGFLLIRPFNFYGGGGALANRYLLPVYPALWFLPVRPLRPAWLAVTAALAAPFLWPLWSAPRAYPLDEHRAPRHVSAAARTLLPFETTQNHLKPAGHVPEEKVHGLWIKPLDPALRIRGEGLVLDPAVGRGSARLLVGREEPIDALHLEIDESALPLEVDGARVTGESEAGPGRRRLWLELDDPRARHPMWWSYDPFTLYALEIDPGPDADEPIELSLFPAVR